MPLAACDRCGKVFSKDTPSSVCPKCQPDEEEDFERIRDRLDKQPNLSAKQLAETTGVDLECVMRLIDGGRIRNVGAGEVVRCGKCGAPAISLSKKLCEACLNRLSQDLAREQAKIRLPERKGVSLGAKPKPTEEPTERRSRGFDFRRRNP